MHEMHNVHISQAYWLPKVWKPRPGKKVDLRAMPRPPGEGVPAGPGLPCEALGEAG
jgi:hypothetical protein